MCYIGKVKEKCAEMNLENAVFMLEMSEHLA